MVLQSEQNMGIQFNKDLREIDVLSNSTAHSVTVVQKHCLENMGKSSFLKKKSL